MRKNKFSIQKNVEKTMKRAGKDPKSAIIIPVGWRNEVLLAEESIDGITIGNMYKKRKEAYDTLLNAFYYGTEDFRVKIKSAIIRLMNAGYKNFVEFHKKPEKIIVVCKIIHYLDSNGKL